MLKMLEKWYRLLKRKFGWIVAIVGSLIGAFWTIDEKLLDSRASKGIGAWFAWLWKSLSDPQVTPLYVLVLLAVAVCLITASAISVPALRTLGRYKSMIEKQREELATLHKQIGIDDLTKIPNRRQLAEAFTTSMAHLAAKSHPFCMGYLDIVDFGKINAKIGHENADIALVEFANIMRNTLRDENDGFFRLSGDQFALIMAKVGISDALRVTRRVTEKLRETPCYAGEDAETGKRLTVDVRCRYGITDCVEGDTVEDCLKRADQALNRAKELDKSFGEDDACRQVVRAPAR
jgi:diguanylate cyclase (GGDEF)-like protein